MHTIYQNESTPKKDGYFMPAEFARQKQVWMLWPHRCDTWRAGARPAQRAYADVARAISEFEPVKVCVNPEDYASARMILGEQKNITVLEMASDDAWIRDSGCTYVQNSDGDIRAVHWHFNAWGGLVDGLYFPWDKDQQVGVKMADLSGVERYRPDDFVLEGGSIHVDGEGTVLTTKMCLLSQGRNPDKTQDEIEGLLCEYLGAEKVIWISDGMDPDETNGHIDDVACFVAPGQVACIWTDDMNNPFYEIAQAAYRELSEAVDARGRQLKVHKVVLPQKLTYMTEDQVSTIDQVEGTVVRTSDDPCIASYLNFLIVNGGVIVPQYGDPYDSLALKQIAALFPSRKVVGVPTREIVFGGGNIHCITQQEPSGVCH